MARVTVEDCLEHIPNRFELSLVAGYRAKCLMSGATQVIDNKKNEKYTVVALREIGDDLLNIEELKQNFKKDVYSQNHKNSVVNITKIEEKNNESKEKVNLLGSIDLDKELDAITEEEGKMFSDENLEVKD